MIWLLVAGVLAVFVVVLVVANEVRIWRGCRRVPVVLTAWPRERHFDVIELSWDEPDDRVRLGRLGQ